MKSCRKVDFCSTGIETVLGESFPVVLLFLHFLFLSLTFSAAKHPSKNDNSEDG